MIVDGELVYAGGFGVADLGHKISITPATVFRLASTSKQFTVNDHATRRKSPSHKLEWMDRLHSLAHEREGQAPDRRDEE